MRMAKMLRGKPERWFQRAELAPGFIVRQMEEVGLGSIVRSLAGGAVYFS